MLEFTATTQLLLISFFWILHEQYRIRQKKNLEACSKRERATKSECKSQVIIRDMPEMLSKWIYAALGFIFQIMWKFINSFKPTLQEQPVNIHILLLCFEIDSITLSFCVNRYNEIVCPYRWSGQSAIHLRRNSSLWIRKEILYLHTYSVKNVERNQNNQMNCLERHAVYKRMKRIYEEVRFLLYNFCRCICILLQRKRQFA